MTFSHADTSAADQKETETRTKKQRKSHLSADIHSKFPDFPVMERKRDRLKQRDKPQQSKTKKAAASVVETPELLLGSTIVSDSGRTDDVHEKMDVLG